MKFPVRLWGLGALLAVLRECSWLYTQRSLLVILDLAARKASADSGALSWGIQSCELRVCLEGEQSHG